ncbi:unnamed protein product [Zymoseptoria tritici ST99CH_1A5]|uniref:Uncharacterized protein n=1 Tax=Zymoseptoria tritici ST99CH_1A5 TaxID=1276529 RepID=A0A1Y6LKK2_ZYMTR|nr:unnamed protein product [Zymoseptoria tritici ST99CH_1A5]
MALGMLIGPHASVDACHTIAAMQAVLGCSQHDIEQLQSLVIQCLSNNPESGYERTWSTIIHANIFWREILAGHRRRGFPRSADSPRSDSQLPADFHTSVEAVKDHMFRTGMSELGKTTARQGDVAAEKLAAKRKWNQDRDQDDEEPQQVRKTKKEEKQPANAPSLPLQAAQTNDDGRPCERHSPNGTTKMTPELPTYLQTTQGQHAADEVSQIGRMPVDEGSARCSEVPTLASPVTLLDGRPRNLGTLDPPSKHTVMQAMEAFLESEMTAHVKQAKIDAEIKGKLDERERDLKKRESLVAEWSATSALKDAEQEKKLAAVETKHNEMLSQEGKFLAERQQLSELKIALATQEQKLATHEKKLSAQAKRQASQEDLLRKKASDLQSRAVKADQDEKMKQKSDMTAKLKQERQLAKEKATWESEMTKRIQAELMERMKRALHGQ